MSTRKRVLLWCALLAAASVFGSGFGLYEASMPTYALGGAVVGRAVDASANFHNPATLTDLTNITVTAGFMTEHPRARMKVWDGVSSKMDSGCFCLPHFHLAVPLPYDFSLGLGMMPEYGLGTRYDRGWELANNSYETTVTSFTLNPNLAWEVIDGLSVGAGLRFLYFDFEQYSRPYVSALGSRFRNHLKGDNGMEDFGWQAGFKYDVTPTFSVGAVYKSRTEVHVEGRTSNRAEVGAFQSFADKASGAAKTELTLPQSVTVGFNWDVAETVHLGGMAAWTDWSSVGKLDFNLAGSHRDVILDWDDTIRVGLAPSWDFAEDWTAMCSYVYETDCCGGQESTMLPAAERHMLSTGLTWRLGWGLEASVGYGIILMDGRGTRARDASGELAQYRAHRGLSHAAGLSLTWRF